MGKHRQQWRRHQVKELQAVLEQFDVAGWTIDDSRKYYKCLCPCPKKHIKTVHLTPSDPNYAKNLTHWLQRHERGEDVP